MRQLIGLACAFGLLASPLAVAEDVATLKVSRVDAFLVSGQSGKLSANIIDPKQPASLWNTIIGEGDAGEPANDVLVIVHVQKPVGDGESPALSLRAVAREGGALLSERKDVYVPFLDQNTGTAIMMLHDVTCTDLDVQVLAGDTQIHTAQIPFACGE